MERFNILVIRQGNDFTIVEGDYSYSNHAIDASSLEEAKQQALVSAKNLIKEQEICEGAKRNP